MTDMIHIEHITKTYEGVEQSLRGTKLEWKGPALWLRNLSKAVRLTTNTAPSVIALRDDYIQLRVPPDNLRLEVTRASVASVLAPEDKSKAA